MTGQRLKMMRAACFGVFCLLLLHAPAQAREAGWVPIEKYASPLLEGKTTRSARETPRRQPAKPQPAAPARQGSSVYAGQPPVTEKELLAFVELLPDFRRWAQRQKEQAHPVVREGQADFLYSPKAGEWVLGHGWNAPRFFCVMGKMAAALVIVEEGNDMRGTRPPDMPSVTQEELALARKHLGSLLRVAYGAY